MIIKKLELHGFKSFSERTRILFHPGITAIIGPNGTGKSNIVDALLWTLRGRRLRTQRGDRTGEHIFNGNANIAPMGMADVAVILGESKTSSQDEDLVINHRLFRSGENEYRLNGKLSRLKDIQESLHQQGIGDTDYFVIEQGSVGLFVTSKPLEKRVLLEEAAGTALYKDKKRQAQNKLDNSEQNLFRLEDILIEVEKTTNSLKRQAQAAIRYRKLREHVRELTLSVYRRRIADLEEKQREAAAGYREKLDIENAVMTQVKEKEKNLSGKRQQVWALEKRLEENKNILFDLKSRQARSESEREREEKRVDFFLEKKRSAETGLTEIQQEKAGLDQEQDEVRAKLEELTSRLEQNQQKLEGARKNLDRAQAALSRQEAGLEQKRSDYLGRLSHQTEVKNDAARVEKELELTSRQRKRLESEVTAQKKLEQERTDLVKSREADLEKLNRELDSTRSGLEDLSRQQERARSALVSARERRDSLQSALAQETHHLNALKKLQEQESSKHAAPKLPGILGQLADFIQTSDKHALLLDVFYKEEARAALIKAHDLRKALESQEIRGEFLLLHPQNLDVSPPDFQDDPRILAMLKTHLKPDPRFRDQLSALGDAAIVRTTQDAVDLWIANPRFHYISLSGDLLLSSGLLKLGKQGEGLISLKRDIEALSRRITQLKQEMEPAEREFQDQTKKNEDLARQRKDLEGRLASLRQQEGIEQNKLEYAVKSLDQARKDLELLENELASLSKESEEATRRWKSSTSSIQDLKRAEQELTESIREEESKLASLREKSEKNRKALFGLQTEVDILREKLQNSRNLQQRLEQRDTQLLRKSEELTREIQESQTEQGRLKQRIHDLLNDAGRADKEIKQQDAELEKLETELRGLKQEAETLEESIRGLREQQGSAEEVRVRWEIKKAERERDLVNLEESCWQELKKTLQEIKSHVALDESRGAEEIDGALEKAQEKLQRIKAVNLMAEEEYQNQKERLDFLSKQRDDLVGSIASTKEAIKKIDQESKTQFLKALIAVNRNFQDVFTILFQGGHAEVKLTDEDNPLESGVEIAAQPPGKRVQSLNLLSGGEKTLTSLAFFFALFRYKPAPFCILDEVDAALDETNLTRFLNLMRNIKEQTQFIIITHNYRTMEVADFIYGTTMAEPNITSIYSVKMEGKTRSSPQNR